MCGCVVCVGVCVCGCMRCVCGVCVCVCVWCVCGVCVCGVWVYEVCVCVCMYENADSVTIDLELTIIFI